MARQWVIKDGYLTHRRTAYDIPIERIDEPANAWAWLVHLSDKTWFDCECRDEFVGTVTSILVEAGYDVVLP